MKRKRGSIATEVDDPEIQPLSPSFVDLPSPITTNILLRLPIKSVLICKCVCKDWHTIISDPHFAKLHFKDAPVISAVLMYHSCNFLIYHERRRHGFNFLKVRGTEFKFEAFAHIPSLISLKDAVKGDVEVQNVHSRCSAFKLREENDVLFLAEENVQQGRLYSSSEDDD
ncbi:putative F-box domain-containing protein [Senna tora]|uniref:Putative F-box domain-containing protein n=1 Tax=Senna tora TaxID=362788 RepID=A0A834U2Q4_9FABA|nr:putative F-box domain-containing protein [Senna tora]